MSDQHAISCPLPNSWDPQHYEPLVYQRWCDAGYFTADPTSDRPAYCIVLPPPNVTGSLHMGHALDHTLMDALTRRKRMQGYEVLWLPGMDHAGIATQNVVEKQLATQGITRAQLTREEFVDRVWEWKTHSGGTIATQMRRLGDGVDWSRERFTMDSQLSYAVRTIFKRLYDAGLIYQAERLVNWSPILETAISDLEVSYREVEGELISFRYGSCQDDQPHIVVATTRLETILGDSAIAVHPHDQRYTHLVGCLVDHPLMDRQIPIIADESVDPDFGTGAVKITPAHDPNDFEVGLRHGLPMPTIFDTKARICGTETIFDGMDRFTARERIRDLLAQQGRIVAEKRPYLHSVGHSERSGEPIEPRLSLQWWVKVDSMAHAAGQAVRTGQTQIYPENLEARWFSWIDDMHDWCISRQLWWGHRIPVWYGPEGQQICCGPDETPPEGWVQDPDVLDTWFSSALWPFSTLGWPQPSAELTKFYPTDVLVTGYDILFFWVARMMMFATFVGEDPVLHSASDPGPTVPFRHIFLHGLIRDEHGKKMSKSRGNGIDPLEWVKEFGADALRFSLARGAHPGADLSIGPAHAYGARNFITKLFNATRFALLRGAHLCPLPDAQSLTDADRWILTRLEQVRISVDDYFDQYDFAKLCDLLYHFIWDEFCDWYLELAKTQADRASTPIVLAIVLDVILRLLHPIIPFVSEVLWTALTGEDSVVISSWPTSIGIDPDPHACQRIGDMQKLVTEIRRFRSDQDLVDRQKVPAKIEGLSQAGLDAHRYAIMTQTSLSEPTEQFSPRATIEVALSQSTVRVHLGTSEVIDIAAERRRLEKDLAAAQKDLLATEAKLTNEQFLTKAPQAVIDKIRDRHHRARQETHRITTRLEELS